LGISWASLPAMNDTLMHVDNSFSPNLQEQEQVQVCT
jgi:hypothetical protein